MPETVPVLHQRTPIWMVCRDGYTGPVTFGPFATREEAEAFARSGSGYVYDAVENLKSNCGPWHL